MNAASGKRFSASIESSLCSVNGIASPINIIVAVSTSHRTLGLRISDMEIAKDRSYLIHASETFRVQFCERYMLKIFADFVESRLVIFKDGTPIQVDRLGT